jgi:Rrf2 family protein
MQITARTDYALRAMLALAEAQPCAVTAVRLSQMHCSSLNYLYAVLAELSRAGFVHARRGPEGGYVLNRPGSEITVGEVVRAMEGTAGGGLLADRAEYDGAATHLPRVWLAANAAQVRVLDQVTLADVVADRLPPAIDALLAAPTTTS